MEFFIASANAIIYVDTKDTCKLARVWGVTRFPQHKQTWVKGAHFHSQGREFTHQGTVPKVWSIDEAVGSFI